MYTTIMHLKARFGTHWQYASNYNIIAWSRFRQQILDIPIKTKAVWMSGAYVPSGSKHVAFQCRSHFINLNRRSSMGHNPFDYQVAGSKHDRTNPAINMSNGAYSFTIYCPHAILKVGHDEYIRGWPLPVRMWDRNNVYLLILACMIL